MLINFKTIFKEEKKLNPLVTQFKAYIAKPCIANGFIFSKSVLDGELMRITIPSSPVVAAFLDNTDGSTLSGHTGDLVKTKNGIKRSPPVQGIGYVLDQSPFWEEYKEEEWLTCYVNIWTGYFEGLQNLSERNIWQSMEIQLDTDKDGKTVMECCLNALCILEGVSPAFDGSTIKEVSFSKKEYSEQVNNLKQELENLNKYSSIDFKIPNSIKLFSNSVLANNQKLTSVCRSNLQYLTSIEYISPEKVYYINKYFSCIQDKKTFSLTGEDVILDWCGLLIKDMKNIDRKDDITLFSSNKSMKEGENKLENFTKIQKDEFANKFSLTANQIKDLLNEECSKIKYGSEEFQCCKYWIWDFDDSYAYGWDEENSEHIAIPFSINADGTTLVDFENVKKAKSLNVWLVEDSENYAENEEDDMGMSFMKEKSMKDQKEFKTKLESKDAEMSEIQSKLSDMETKLGEQFAATTSLETALEDEKKISEERQSEIDRLSAELKKLADSKKESDVKTLLSKKEFSVFSEEKKLELTSLSLSKTDEDFKTFVYAELGRFASENLEYDEQTKKFSTIYIPQTSNNITNKDGKEDVYAEARKKFGIEDNK